MSLVTAQKVLDYTQVGDSDIADKVVKFGPAAQTRMKGILTRRNKDLRFSPRHSTRSLSASRRFGDLYEEINDLEGDFDQSDKDQLTRAETLWAFGESIPTLGLRQADDGGFVQSTGFDQSRTNYKRADEVFQFASDRKGQARRLATDLRPNTERRTTWVI